MEKMKKMKKKEKKKNGEKMKRRKKINENEENEKMKKNDFFKKTKEGGPDLGRYPSGITYHMKMCFGFRVNPPVSSRLVCCC